MRRGLAKASGAILVISVLVLTACSGSDDAPLDLPETSALVGQRSYALVIEQYVRFHESPEHVAAVIAHRRAGDVLSVVGTTANEEWTEVRLSDGSGLVQSIHIRRFANRRQAINARRLLEE